MPQGRYRKQKVPYCKVKTVQKHWRAIARRDLKKWNENRFSKKRMWCLPPYYWSRRLVAQYRSRGYRRKKWDALQMTTCRKTDKNSWNPMKQCDHLVNRKTSVLFNLGSIVDSLYGRTSGHLSHILMLISMCITTEPISNNTLDLPFPTIRHLCTSTSQSVDA
jgi:hypothetical protein